ASHGFGLGEIQHPYPVSFGCIVGGAEFDDAILVAGEEAPQQPTAGAIVRPTLPAKVRLSPHQRLPVWLPASLEPAAGAAAGQIGVLYQTNHEPIIGRLSSFAGVTDYWKINALASFCVCPGLPAWPSHGENRGSSPLGSANKLKHLYRLHGMRFLV